MTHTDHHHSFVAKPVTVVVGEGDSATTFYIHEEAAKAHSDFLAAALHKGWKEAEDKVIKLPEDNAGLFNIFVRFVHTGRVYCAEEGDVSEKNGVSRDQEWSRLTKSWLLGDKLGSTSFKDAIIDALIEKILTVRFTPTWLHATVYMYLGTASNSGLRRLGVDVAVWKWSHQDMCEAETGTWHQFFKDVAIRFQGLSEADRKGLPPFCGPASCKYHEHVAADKPCYKTLFP